MSEPLVRYLQIQAAANRLMNYRLHTVIAQLPQQEFKAPRVSFFPSLWQTLNHILIVDWYYLDVMEQGGRGRSVFKDETPFDSMQALAREQAAADLRLIKFCNALTARDLARQVHCDRGERGMVPTRIDRLLPHVFMHQTHHRGQAHAMLSGTAVKPPQLDEFFLAEDAQFRAEELRACGLTEADLDPAAAPTTVS